MFKSRSLINSYLTGRKSRCREKNCISGEATLDMGVGEGSVLGPGFFICGMCSVGVVAKRVRIEIGEAGFLIEVTCLKFADDTFGLIVAKDKAKLQVTVHLMMEKFQHYFNSMEMCLT